jgi:hypothetical protein
VSFTLASATPIKVVSVTGVSFAASSAPSSGSCTGLPAGSASLIGSSTLVFAVTTPGANTGAIVCQFVGLQNIAAAAAATASVTIATYDGSGVGIDTVSSVVFPAIFGSSVQFPVDVNGSSCSTGSVMLLLLYILFLVFEFCCRLFFKVFMSSFLLPCLFVFFWVSVLLSLRQCLSALCLQFKCRVPMPCWAIRPCNALGSNHLEVAKYDLWGNPWNQLLEIQPLTSDSIFR